jgi:AAA ATPase domain/Protein kinase domain
MRCGMNWTQHGRPDPLSLADYQGLQALVLEDPGGNSLDRLIGGVLNTKQFLRTAIGIAKTLGRFHARGLVHRDVRPGNILINTATGDAWLMGFGLTSRLPQQRQSPEAPEVIAGTLEYMAPEQTGRMNRSIDSRSDLYSLGVTLYEMLAGALPFTASDPMEWVHCHLARQPLAPSERVSNIPEPISAIVMKLLSKTAEDRYQTAAGVEADLRRCLIEWETRGRIAPFPLGADDVPDHLLIPERLYGRESEIKLLLAAFDRVADRGTTELVLVSGYSGVGKSSVVNELQKALVPSRGLFASGKFDQYKRDIPYATLAQAFQQLARQILGQSERELLRWRATILQALGPNGQLMVNLIPDLELIIGNQPPVAELLPQDAQNRFQMAFRRLLAVFARPEHPLALFLDDLQWLDAATLQLLQYLITHDEVRHLLLIGAFRDNEVGLSHPLMRTLAELRKTAAPIHEIGLANLSLEDVGRLVRETLHCERERAHPLAQLVYEKTAGNPFFAIQFFAMLAEEGTARLRPGGRNLEMGPGAYPRQRIYRQRGGADGRETEAVLRRHPGSPETACLPRQCRRDRHSDLGLWRSSGGDTCSTLGCRPRRARLSPGEHLQISARPHPAGGLCPDSRGAPGRNPPAHRPCAVGEPERGRTRRAAVRCREPVESGRGTAG